MTGVRTQSLGERLAAARSASAFAAYEARRPGAAQRPKASDDVVRRNTRSKVGASLKPRSRKDQPRELSSRRPVPLGRSRCLGIDEAAAGTVSHGSSKSVDPRFEEHCGTISDAHVQRNYDFLQELRARELSDARKALQMEPANFMLKSKVRKLEAQHSRWLAQQRRQAIRTELKAEEREKVKLGKKPYFFKESVIRDRELKAKFEDLKSRGGVQKYIAKRRKRQVSKDRKLLLRRRVDLKHK